VTFSHEEIPMSLRRAGPLALALSLVACHGVTQEPRPEKVVLATFASPNIPLPNDLALNAVPTLTAPELAAQKALLEAFNGAGGFPNDQEVSVSFPVHALKLDTATSTYVADSAPRIDPASVRDLRDATATVAVYRIDVSPPVRVDVDSDVGTAGVLKLRKKADASGSRRWTPNARYVAAIRGGPSGVKGTNGLPVQADQAIALVAPNLDLSLRDNQPPGGLTPALVSQLESLRKALWQPLAWCNMPVLPPAVLALGLVPGWNPVASPSLAALCSPAAVAPATSAFGAVQTAFAPGEVASIATFTVAPEAGTYVTIDSGSGVAPLPFDLMRDPIPGFTNPADPTKDTGLIFYNQALGAAGVGLATLDGFSTTAMVIAQTGGNAVAGGNVIATGGAILAASVTPATARLYRRAGDGSWSQVLAVATQPPAIQSPTGCPVGNCSVLIGLQPAVGVAKAAATPPLPNNLVSFPPLDENTMYAVVITDGVRDAANQPLVRSTVAKILLGIDPAIPLGVMVSGTPVSLLGGVDGVTAIGLQKMRAELTDLFTKAAITKAAVASAWTFKTQSIRRTSAGLAGLPYQLDQGVYAASGNTQVAITPMTATNIPIAAFPGVPTSGVNAFYDVTFMSVDAIDKSTGALNPAIANPALLPGLLAPLHALVVVPDPASAAVQAATCPPGYPTAARCPRLVIFGHGLNGSKETLLSNAATLASHGFIAAAIDFPLHGGRNWCAADADCVNADGTPGAAGSCDKAGAFKDSATQGDAVRPGVCAGVTSPKLFSAPYVNVPSRYFVSANFFRVRDAFRQNILDVSALTLALNRPPSIYYPPQPAAGTNPFVNALAAKGLFVDPTTTSYEGISLGSISGTSAVAANPRISRALLSVGGGTAFDIFTTSPAFHAGTGALLASLIPGFSWDAIDPANPAFNKSVAGAYLKVSSVAKWILDPGDPINYASALIDNPMPDFLVDRTFLTPQAPKQVLGQVAALDQVVPNTNNWLLYELMGADTSFYVSGPSTTPLPYSVPHGMLATIPSVQADAAGYLLTGTPTATTITLP
jgi:hypothetical protein